MNNEWKFDVADFGKVRVSHLLLKCLSEYRQLNLDTPESGGVLIGKYLNSGGTLLIDDLTPPQEKDRQGRCSYYRSKEHNILVRKKWNESDYHSTYVGLWHTHPEPRPSYSSADENDWLNAIKNSSYEGKRLFFIIVGQTHVKIWLGKKKLIGSEIKLIGEFKIEN